MPKKRITISYEVEIPEGTSKDIVEEAAIALIPSQDTIDDFECLYDEVYDITASRGAAKVSVEEYGEWEVEDTEDFYDKHREEYEEKYPWD